MGFVKEYYMPDVDDYNDEYFFEMEERYYDALDVLDSMREAQLEDEFNVVELNNAVNLISQLAEEFGLSADKATAALKDFIKEYESVVALDMD